ncbi:hypothetical protein BGZ61DRAFT_561539 [Ilyonectria robusta]|uniref:uncharacterized protein n=1 Tax=Ilyonectria robusta TaxID=1079257 RepID=UPI001E8DDC9F|nr:uncharacterized protein BGZ61DRAFT_561539 [Ilyonectria robusta]KAH8665442.1 hypothetical protein BGZ61DRAFT_561539 [Ilyonectria robusta]
MRLPLEISSREALAAPTDVSQIRIQSVVILIVSICSILGAGWIILNFFCFKNLRSFRHQLILGLAISDFIMALNFLLSTSMNISKRYIQAPEQAAFCNFNGFMTQVFVVQTDYWVLTISICTYLILADHKHLTSWVQDHEKVLFLIPWMLSLLWAGLGLWLAGYGDIGAWCWFTSDKVRLLVNFVPRWIIIVAILAMYSRLYFFLHRAHRSFLSFGDSSSEPHGSCRTIDGAVEMRGAARGLAEGANHAAQGRYGSEKTIRRLKMTARLMLMYPVAYMLIWLLPTIIRIYQATRGRPAPFALQTIDKSCIVIQGLVDAVIYGMNEGSRRQWRELLFNFRVSGPSGSTGPQVNKTQTGQGIVTIPTNRAIRNDSASSFENILTATESTERITRDPQM